MTEETKKTVDRIERNFERGIIGAETRESMIYELFVEGKLTEAEHFELSRPDTSHQE